MSVFLEYLEEAYVNASALLVSEVKLYITPYINKLLETGNWSEDELIQLKESPIPQMVQDYFETEFERCVVCEEWNRKDEMHYGHNSNQGVCPNCKGVYI